MLKTTEPMSVRGKLIEELFAIEQLLRQLQKPHRKRRSQAVVARRRDRVRQLRDRQHEIRRWLKRSDSVLERQQTEVLYSSL